MLTRGHRGLSPCGCPVDDRRDHTADRAVEDQVLHLALFGTQAGEVPTLVYLRIYSSDLDNLSCEISFPSPARGA